MLQASKTKLFKAQQLIGSIKECPEDEAFRNFLIEQIEFWKNPKDENKNHEVRGEDISKGE